MRSEGSLGCGRAVHDEWDLIMPNSLFFLSQRRTGKRKTDDSEPAVRPLCVRDLSSPYIAGAWYRVVDARLQLLAYNLLLSEMVTFSPLVLPAQVLESVFVHSPDLEYRVSCRYMSRLACRSRYV